jgi:hypothetical protein
MKHYYLAITILLFAACSCSKSGNSAQDNNPPDNPQGGVPEAVYDETGCLYTSYENLVMAGYQGWFAAEGDESQRGWYHLQNGSCGGFKPGCSTVDFWPDMREYTKTYPSPFQFSDGTNATLYSPYDEASVDLHFKWMKDYGIDGVFMQRFLMEVKNNPKGKRHFNKVLSNALKAANKYGRAICIMYDLSGASSADIPYLEQDWNELVTQFKLFDNKLNPTYLRHKKKPLMSIWGVGFNDNRRYNTADVTTLVEKLKGPEKKVSIMLGVPYYWRSNGNDTEKNPALHELIKKTDIVMPWAVGRYGNGNYATIAAANLGADVQWCNSNRVDYVPLVFPGFSWGNMHNDTSMYNSIPRLKGEFLWKQVHGAKSSGAKSLYVAMFDEIDEGTAIFKCAREGELPLHGDRRFIGIEAELESDYYLWLTGQAGKWFHGESGFTAKKPVR